jgi:transposase-like protein
LARKHIKWSDEDKAAAYVVWVTNDKNVLRTARETGVAQNTLRYWVAEWRKSGPPDAVADRVEGKVEEFVSRASRIRNSAMDKLEELIPEAEVKQMGTLGTIVGIMDDKIRLASGLATKRTETVHTLPSREDMKDLMSGFVDGLIGAAESRAEEIVDAEIVEQPGLSGLLDKGE